MTQLSLLDYEPPAQKHSATSVEAAEKIKPSLGYLQSLVLSAIRRSGFTGLTDNEGIEELQISPSTYRPRRIELVAKGWVVDSGGLRQTASGRKAVVWVCKEFGP